MVLLRTTILSLLLASSAFGNNVNDDLLDEIFGIGSYGEEQEQGDDHCRTSADCNGGRGGCARSSSGVKRCRCSPPYSGRNCQECKTCPSAPACASLLHCVQCASLNFFWVDERTGDDHIDADCPHHCKDLEYIVEGGLSQSGIFKPEQLCRAELLDGRCFVEAAPPQGGQVKHTTISCQGGTEEAALEEGFYSGMMSDCDGEMLPDGMGVLEYREGDRSRRKRYFGLFSCGDRHGRGLLEWEDGSSYSGDFSPSFGGGRSGRGRMEYRRSGRRVAQYVGEWENGTRHGQGIYVGDKQIYVGGFSHGRREGEGEVYSMEGDQETPLFSGVFKHGRLHSGELNMETVTPDQDEEEDERAAAHYQGDFKNGKFDGQGSFTDICGNQYEGEWSKGMREGAGNLTWIRGETYEGSWKLDHRDGPGFFSWINGEMYEGSFSSDLPHGQGEFYWMDGSGYRGRFEEGLMTEDGEYIDSPVDVRKTKVEEFK